MATQPSITCSKCGRTSYHPKDIEQSYCGYCHVFTRLPVPVITVEQLNRRGACIADILRFKNLYGDATEVTVAKAVHVCSIFDFGWAMVELLHEQHGKQVFDAIAKRCAPPPGETEWTDGETSLLQATAEEFARKYVEVYPNVP
jgi:hypothetical protein